MGLAFALKLLALAGWAPRLDACASCGSEAPLIGYDVVAGGATCAACGGFAVSPETLAATHELLARPLGAAATPTPNATGGVLRIVRESVAAHTAGGLRTLGG